MYNPRNAKYSDRRKAKPPPQRQPKTTSYAIKSYAIKSYTAPKRSFERRVKL